MRSLRSWSSGSSVPMATRNSGAKAPIAISRRSRNSSRARPWARYACMASLRRGRSSATSRARPCASRCRTIRRPWRARRQNTVSVSYATLELPDLFKDGAEVIVEGELEGSGAAAVFHATNVLREVPVEVPGEAAGTPHSESRADLTRGRTRCAHEEELVGSRTYALRIALVIALIGIGAGVAAGLRARRLPGGAPDGDAAAWTRVAERAVLFRLRLRDARHGARCSRRSRTTTSRSPTSLSTPPAA